MIYQLKYSNKEVAVQDLLQKGVLINVTDLQDEEALSYAPKKHAVVHVGLIVDTPAVMDGMEVVTSATYLNGWHVDVMSDEVLEFDCIVTPKSPSHTFLSNVPFDDSVVIDRLI